MQQQKLMAQDLELPQAAVAIRRVHLKRMGRCRLSNSRTPFPNNLAYYVEGDELLATRLKLKLHVNEIAHFIEAEQRFVEIGNALLDKATGHRPLQNVAPVQSVLGRHRIAVKKDAWSGGIKGGYDVMLTIEIVE